MADPVLQIRDLNKSFGALKATENVSLDLRDGEIHALIGPNGAGKSTLIHQVAGMLKPDSGEIAFLGQPVGHLGVAERAQLGLGRSFQVSSLAQRSSTWLRGKRLQRRRAGATCSPILPPILPPLYSG